MQAYLEAVNSP